MSLPSELDIVGVAAELKYRKHELQDEMRAKLSEMQSSHIGFDLPNAIDGGDVASLEGAESLHIAVVQRDATELQEIECALQRIASGTFGKCVDCGLYIGTERLKAIPSASHCASCQREAEFRSLSTHHHPGD